MKIFILFTLVITIIYISTNFIFNSRSNISNVSFMDRRYTTILKGIAILTIIWGHVGARLGVGSIQFIAGIGVTLFLICSGYGIMQSYISKGLEKYWIKKWIKVIVPFYIVEIIGLFCIKKISFAIVLKDFLFLKPATAYGWYMGYIIICYLIFWIIMKLGSYFNIKIEKRITGILLIFMIWFIFDSIFLANPSMSFLRARQMLSFPFGVVLAYIVSEKINSFDHLIHKSTLFAIMLGCILVGLGMMFVTQFEVVKNLPYILSNILSLFTCLPLAISIMIFVNLLPEFSMNVFLNILGVYSYELYLVHAFSLSIIKPTILSLISFIAITIIGFLLLRFINKQLSKRVGM